MGQRQDFYKVPSEQARARRHTRAHADMSYQSMLPCFFIFFKSLIAMLLPVPP